MTNLQNKVAIITGARRGMGKADALLLAKAGAKVVVSDISKDDCEKVVEEIKKAGGEAMAVQCDVSKKKEVDDMVKQVINKWGKIDILINNAGICQFKSFLEMAEEEWDKTLDINLKGYFLCAQAAAKEMAKNKSGVIVNIASIAMGQQGVGMPGIVHYCASKGGIAAMTEALAVELAPFGIRVNAIAPGIIDTPMVSGAGLDQKAIEGMLTRVPLRRMGKAEEIANPVLFLASDDSSYMTGATIVVDGGWLAV
ncbi:MAG: glucose 1-dehydrogenase [Patescibacteria group bacterium]